MPSQAPNDFDPDIPLRVKGPLDQLGGFEGAIGLAGRLQLGKMAQGATDENGNVDYDKLLSSAAQNPFTVQYINPLRQAQLTQRQIIGLVQTQNKQNSDDVNMLLASTASNPAEALPMLQAFLSRVPQANRAAAATYADTLLRGALTSNGKLLDPSTPEGQAAFKANMVPLAAASGMNATQVGTAFMPPGVVAQGYTSPTEAAKPVSGPVDAFGNPTNITQVQFGSNLLAPSAPRGGNALGPTAAGGVTTQLGPGEQEAYKNVSTQETDVNQAVQDLQPIALAMKAERDAAAKFQMGGGASERAKIAQALQAAQHAGAPIPQKIIDAVGDGSLADVQTFTAAMTPVIMGQFKQAVQGTGRGLMLEAKAYFDRYPNPNTDPNAYENISNMLSKGFDQLMSEQQFVKQFKSDLRAGKLPRGTKYTDWPAMWEKEQQAKGILAFPEFHGALGAKDNTGGGEAGQTVPIQAGGVRRPLSEIFGTP